LSWPLPDDVSDGDLERMLFPRSAGDVRGSFAQLDWAYIHAELRRKGVTLALLWEEYRAVHPDGYGYSRFCELYTRWEGKLSPVMRQRHAAGERLFVDYAGATIDVACPETGEVRQAQLFVAALGASNRGELVAEAARLDRQSHAGLCVLRRRDCPDRVGQSQGGRHQGLFLRSGD
jgi:transposase